MGRYTGPRVKISRREGTDIFDNPRWNKRNFPPGQHGQKKTRGNSDYGKQLREKQKAKLMYGLFERQFANLFQKAQSAEGEVGINLLKALEQRLDNVLYRGGLAKTRRLARQLVSHGHIRVNDKKTDIPSYRVKTGEVISIKASKLKQPYWLTLSEKVKKVETPSWIKTDLTAMNITVTGEPIKNDLPQNIETNLIIEFYSR